MKKEAEGQLFTEAPMGKLLLRLCVPSVLTIFVLILYNMADLYFVGKTGDSLQVAAVSLSAPVFSLIQAVGTLLGAGGCSAAAIAFGRGQEMRVRKISSFCVWSSLGAGAVLAFAVCLFCAPILALLGAEGGAAAFTARYITILSLGAPALMLSNSFASVIRYDGSVVQAVLGNAVGTLANFILDPILILGLRMGVSGAALATVAGNLLSCLYLIFAARKKSGLSLSLRALKSKERVAWNVLALGWPSAVSVVLSAVSAVLCNRMLGEYGTAPVAASGIAGKAGFLIVMLQMGICMGAQPAIAYNFGAGAGERLGKILRSVLLTTILVGAAASLGCFLFREGFLGLFTKDPELLSLGNTMLLAGVAAGPVFGVYQLSVSFLQSVDQPGRATFSSVLRQGLVLIPVLFFMKAFWGLNGVILAGPAADLLSAALAGWIALGAYRRLRQ